MKKTQKSELLRLWGKFDTWESRLYSQGNGIEKLQKEAICHARTGHSLSLEYVSGNIYTFNCVLCRFKYYVLEEELTDKEKELVAATLKEKI